VEARAGSIAGDSFDRSEEDDELDPVALNKAFVFASWSSIALVCLCFVRISEDLTQTCAPVHHPHHHRPPSPLFLPLRLRCWRFDRMGCCRNRMDLLLRHIRRPLPTLGEQARDHNDLFWNLQGTLHK